MASSPNNTVVQTRKNPPKCKYPYEEFLRCDAKPYAFVRGTTEPWGWLCTQCSIELSSEPVHDSSVAKIINFGFQILEHLDEENSAKVYHAHFWNPPGALICMNFMSRKHGCRWKPKPQEMCWLPSVRWQQPGLNENHYACPGCSVKEDEFKHYIHRSTDRNGKPPDKRLVRHFDRVGPIYFLMEDMWKIKDYRFVYVNNFKKGFVCTNSNSGRGGQWGVPCGWIWGQGFDFTSSDNDPVRSDRCRTVHGCLNHQNKKWNLEDLLMSQQMNQPRAVWLVDQGILHQGMLPL